MDVQMPDVDGLEATRMVRATGSEVLDAGVPIIAMTAHAMPGDRKTCLDAGMNDYIAKPVTPAALSALLAKWLEKLAPKAGAASLVGGQQAPPSADLGAVSAVFDEAALIDRAAGDRNLAQAIARSFLADVSSRIASVRGHLAAGETHTVQLQAHTIKGAAAAVGGKSVFALALALESSGSRGDLVAAISGLEALACEFDRLRQAMEASSLLTNP
jgi:CheY-like chemotaxis protein